jgi:hypothetical protein
MLDFYKLEHKPGKSNGSDATSHNRARMDN